MPTYKYPHPALTVDIVVFGVDWRNDSLDVLLIRRKNKPFAGQLALPGGFVEMQETAEQAAFRELREETGVRPTHLEQLYTFSDPERDPRERVVTISHLALVRSQDHIVQANSDAAEAYWVNARKVIKNKDLAFDHIEILRLGLARLEGKIRYAPIGMDLLPTTFTLLELRSLYKIILGREPDPSNFRRKIEKFDFLVPLGSNHKGRSIFRFDLERYEEAVAKGILFEI